MTASINANTTTGVVVTSDTSGALALQTGGTTALTINSSQNVGIGTSSPLDKLDVISASATYRNRIRNSGANEATLLFQNSSTGTASGDGLYLGILGSMDAYLWNYENNPIIFGTNNAERARIGSNGFAHFQGNGTYYNASGPWHSFESATADDTFLVVNSNASPYGENVFFTTGTAPNNATNYFYNAFDVSATRFQVRSNGGIANYAANNVVLSDRREKTNFATATSYLDKICAIPVQTFNYIDQNMEEDGGLTLGVVAQDVQAVAPELVTEGNWGTKENPKMRLEIYQTDFQYALMKCIQELSTQVTELKAEVQALKGA